MSAHSALLDGYPEILDDVCRTGRRLTRRERDARRRLGVAAAADNVPLGTVVDLYLTATRRAWADLTVPPARAHEVAGAVLDAANDAIVALTKGYDEAQRTAIRAEEAARREFVDDLLLGGDPGRLAERAGRFGLVLTAPHVVAVVRGEQPFGDTDERTRRAAELARSRLGSALVATKEGLLVCVVPSGDDAAVADRMREAMGHDRPGTVGVGRPYPGPGGVARSYDDARTALDLARRLGLPAGQVLGADLLVYQVLGRDRAAMVDLVATVLEPLRGARGGAQPLLDTLTAYFTAGSAAAAARALHLSVRAFTYRLARVQQLTGYDPVAPAQRYTLETAVLGARMLGWPANDLPPRG
ncbi:PucR family transcriptional regulator [Virgisporangium aliadipatigenens]|nr:helix-turn-helix domain-containing protein [Virgisporangium aliadipatigenens]